jgi:general secretion pathway protein F/type IV pilus assembly protein PilC
MREHRVKYVGFQGRGIERMNTFRYVARERGGGQVTGTVSAATLEEASRTIREQSLFPVSVEKTRALLPVQSRGKKVRPRILAKFYSQMSDLLHSGVPLLRSLEIIGRQSASPRLSEILTDIRKRVADGQTLADAMHVHEAVFGELAVSMVRAGQEGGFLEDVFKRTSIFTDRQEDLRGRVVGALAYPLFLSGVGFLVIGVLLIFFVPKFAEIFDRLRERGELPAATEILLATSQTLQDYGLFFLIGLVVLGFFLRSRLETPEGRRLVDGWKLKAPILGSVFRDLAITRFNRVLGTLRRNGIPLLQALRIAKDSTGNVLMKEAIDRAADNVQSGDKLATPLRASGCFPVEIVEMIEVAEESNTLEDVLLSSADSLENQTTRQLEIAVRFLEPMLLLVMAAVTLVVVVALLLPIFKMSSAVG